MRKSALLLLSFLLLSSVVINAQKNRIYKWPVGNWTYAKVYVYNIENQLLGDYQLVKNGKLNKTVTDTGRTLSQAQLTQLLNVINGDTRILNEGLAKCYEPHHGVVFYNEKKEIVSGFDVCFLCQGIKFYPSKREKETTSEYSESAIKKAEAQLEVIKKIIKSTNTPVYETSQDYRKLIQKNTNDTLELINDSVFSGLLNTYSTLAQLIQKNRIKINSLDSTTKFTYGKDKVKFYRLTSNEFNLNASSFNEGSLWITKIDLKDKSTYLFEKLKIGMRKITFLETYPYLTRNYFYENTLIVYSTNKNEKLIVRFHPGNGTIQYIGYDFNH